MKLVDLNVLLYAVDEGSAMNRVARAWLDSSLSGREPVGFAWLVVVGFLRVATHEGIFTNPFSGAEALDVVDAWLDADPSVTLDPTPRHLSLVRNLLADLPAGNLVNDAHLAALAIEHGGTVYSFDRDFGRFPGVRSELPSV